MAADLPAFTRTLRDGTLLTPAYAGLLTDGKMIMPFRNSRASPAGSCSTATASWTPW